MHPNGHMRPYHPQDDRQSFARGRGYQQLEQGGATNQANSERVFANRGQMNHRPAGGVFQDQHMASVSGEQPNPSGNASNDSDDSDKPGREMESSNIGNFFNELIGYDTTFETLYIFNFWTAGVHAISAVVVFILAVNLETKVARTQECALRNYTDTSGPYIADTCFVNSTLYNRTGLMYYKKTEEIFDVKIYYGVLITMFFTLSALFQGGQGIFKESYRIRVETNQANKIRYVEYSLSASIMMMALAASLAITDIYTHILIFTCTAICMILGLMADYARVLEHTIRSDDKFPVELQPPTMLNPNLPPKVEPQPPTVEGIEESENLWTVCARDVRDLKLALHMLSWFSILVPFLFVFGVAWLRSVLQSGTCSHDQDNLGRGPPGWVTALIVVEFALFLAFGGVQIYQILSTETSQKTIGIRAERIFIFLSALSKSLLGWIIVANIFIP
jgi:hypothetical protein